MFSFAFLIGIYSFIILILGTCSQLYKNNILIATILFLLATIIVFVKSFDRLKLEREINQILKSKLNKAILIFIFAQIAINLIGVFGPEISFDALWYHLTLPKIFLENNAIFHIPGGLLYYSDLPKLGEILYIPALAFSNEIAAKFSHFLFGIFTLYVIYRISRKFLNTQFSLLAVLIFYSNLVVGWLTITAYVDLIRVFFELVAFWAFLEWIETKKNKWLAECAIFVGLATCVKLTGLFSLFIYLMLLIFFLKKQKITKVITKILIFICFCVIIPLPYFVLSYLNTGNPLYPLFSGIIKTDFNYSLQFLFKEVFRLLSSAADPISPIYLIFIPLVIFFYKKTILPVKIIFAIGVLSFIIIIVEQVGDNSRFFLPYLAIVSIGIADVLFRIKIALLKNSMIFTILFLSIVSIGYRAAANYKYVPYLLGKETKQQFLVSHLNFSFEDFYDINGDLAKRIGLNDKALLVGVNSLYYVDFPFIDWSWVKEGDTFNYIVTQNSDLPSRFKFWKIIYSNSTTNVNLYTFERIKWVY